MPQGWGTANPPADIPAACGQSAGPAGVKPKPGSAGTGGCILRPDGNQDPLELDPLGPCEKRGIRD